jgi:GH25 family lysozyme M1 (1,4-beta-N-acetylmuramidase)
MTPKKRAGGIFAGAVVLAMLAVASVQTSAMAETVADNTGGGYAHAGAPTGASANGSGSAQRATAAAPAGYPITGIDISSNDHNVFPTIDWPTVAANNKFVYIKATEGLTYTNPYFAADYQAARDNGLLVGAYTFGRPDKGNAVGQADFLMDHALWSADSQTLIPFLDIEAPYPGVGLPECWNQTPAQLTQWVRDFVTEVQHRIGRPPMIYTGNWWKDCTGNDATFGNYPLDIAYWSSNPPPTLPASWTSFTIWQFHGGNNGQKGNYDQNAFNGDLQSLKGLTGANPVQTLALRSHSNNLFVSTSGSTLTATKGIRGPWETYDAVDLGNGYTALRSHTNGMYVSADAAGTNPLIANRGSAGDWESFTLIHNADGSVSLKAKANGLYVTAAGTAPLIANRTSIGAWESFDGIVDPTVVSLRARANSMYVTADAGGSKPLIANRSSVGQWESYDLLDLNNGWVVLQSHANNQYVTASSSPLIASGSALDIAQMFQVVRNSDGSVFLKAAANGYYVSADAAGTAPLIANRATPGAWEAFDLNTL